MMRTARAIALGMLLGSFIMPVTAGTAQTASAADTSATAVSNVELAWGLNNEANNAAFAPGTYNFFSAGKISNPGKGGMKIGAKGSEWSNGKAAKWSASSGNVSIVKNRTSGRRPMKWGDFRTDSRGRAINSPTDSRFSDHEVVVSNGDGWIDTDDGRAKIRWDGDFTVIYYTGMSFFYVSDPELNVGANGKGRLTATVGGYGSSQYDQSVWRPLADRRVVLAELDDIDIASGKARTRPAYKGVRVTIGNNGVPQVRSGRHWGAWPQSFVTYQQRAGQGSYWYSSGGQTDVHKVPLPLDLTGTDFGDEITVPAGDPRDTALPADDDKDDPDNNHGPNDDKDNNNGNDPDNDGEDRDENGPDENDGDGDEDAKPFEVDDAQFRWGFNKESNNAGFAPDTYNFFAAGRIDDPGQGGQSISRSDWSAATGNVTIEKRQPDGSYDTATWDGLSTTPSGEDLSSPTAGRFSDHQVVMDGGSGTINPRQGTARITWDGDFTVLYYSGMTFFYVSDPTLVVRNGRGTVTATLGGFGTDRSDMTTWERLPEKRVTLANLGKVGLGKNGFAAKPTYLGVRYQAPKSIGAQQRGDAFGSFPKSFVDYQVRTGQASYWYSSGGQTDRYKIASPMTVSYDADNAITPPEDERPQPDDDPTDEPPDDGSPTLGPDDDNDTAPDPTTDTDSATQPASEDPALAASPLSTTHSADQREMHTAAASTPARTWMWWLGGGLLAIAVALTLTTTLLTQRRSSQSRSTD